MSTTAIKRCQEIDQQHLPPHSSSSSMSLPRIAIFGSVDFYHADSPFLCEQIGLEIANRIPQACILTGANAVIQERLSRAFYDKHKQQHYQSKSSTVESAGAQVFHLVPTGSTCPWDFGTCIDEAGRDHEERRFILATLATVCIAIEGGPGTADEISKALQAGIVVIPLGRTGGASAGMFDAPKPNRPSYVDSAIWDLLYDETVKLQDSVDAVISIVLAVLDHHQHCQQQQQQQQQSVTDTPSASKTAKQKCNKVAMEKAIEGALGDVQYTRAFSKRPVLPSNSPAYVEPTLFGCAHLVVDGSEGTSIISDGRPVGSIYLGPQKSAEPPAWNDLVAANIQGIVNCTPRVPCHFQNANYSDDDDDMNTGIRYCIVAVNDEDHADILTYLEGATAFLHHLVVTRRKSVLVHCQRGISRSATVVLAYLIRFHNMTRDEAYLHVKAIRLSISPNPGFWDQLKTFEDQCRQEGRIDQSREEPTSREEVIDTTWVQKFNALFATCRWMPDVLKTSRYICSLESVKSNRDHEHVLCICLDYIWGRGILDIDLEWLKFVCQSLDDSIASSRTKAFPTTGQHPAAAATTVQEILQNEDSELWDDWAGEIYPQQIQKVLDKLNLTRSKERK